jgi:hypothetical protein
MAAAVQDSPDSFEADKARRDRRSHEGAAGVDASRFYPDDDERLWKGNDRLETQSQQSGCRVVFAKRLWGESRT